MHGKTIAAISTPPGKGGVAVIRISGDEALRIAERIFLPKGNKKITEVATRVQIFGDILLSGERIDDGLLTYFKAPHSYTGEDVIEISCHGGMLVSSLVLESALREGAFMAEAGEFTRRALISGKISLTDAEAIGILLEAESVSQVRLGNAPARDALSRKIEEIRVELTSLLSSVFARIDYPDEDLGELSQEMISAGAKDILKKVERLISSYKVGRAITEGVPTVICGKPNVGKSTLYNLLLGRDAAIVTSIPGTTRDVLEASASLGSVMLRLADTAGIRRDTEDAVERIGIERSRSRLGEAKLVLALFDATRELDSEDTDIIQELEASSAVKLAIITKAQSGKRATEITDLPKGVFYDIIEIDSECDPDTALELIKRAAERIYNEEGLDIGNDAIVATARQNAALIRAKEHILRATEAYALGIPEDAAASDLELALSSIGELDGREISEAIVADIFAKFCVGK